MTIRNHSLRPRHFGGLLIGAFVILGAIYGVSIPQSTDVAVIENHEAHDRTAVRSGLAERLAALGQPRPLEKSGALSLRLSEPAAVSESDADTPASASPGAVSPESAPAAHFVERSDTGDEAQSLNLDVPVTPQPATRVTQVRTEPAAVGRRSRLDLVARGDDSFPVVDSINLFNPDYGLRGFMKQNWINQRVAVQGGLGLNDDRVFETAGDRRNDIAVGMGVIVAF